MPPPEWRSTRGATASRSTPGQHSLVRQFLSGLTNHRGDEWADRLLFARQVIEQVRRASGAALVGLRLSCDELAPWAGITPEMAPDIAVQLCSLGVDYLVVVRGSIFSANATRPDHHEAPGFNIELTRQVRAALRAAQSQVPVFLQGSVVDGGQAEWAIGDGVADGVEMTRAQIADADLVAKWRAGAAERIRPCIRCNQTCQVRDARNPIVTCVVEPSSGHEATDPDWSRANGRPRSTSPSSAPAWPGSRPPESAALRGHRVRVVERSAEVGGVAAIAGPGRAFVDWLDAECRRLGVTISLNTDWVDAPRAGRRPRRAGHRQPSAACATYDIEGDVIVLDIVDVRRGTVALPDDGTVVLLDPIGGPIAVDLAEALGERAVLVTHDQIAGNELSRSGDLAPANVRLAQRGVRVERRAIVRTVRPAHTVSGRRRDRGRARRSLQRRATSGAVRRRGRLRLPTAHRPAARRHRCRRRLRGTAHHPGSRARGAPRRPRAVDVAVATRKHPSSDGVVVQTDPMDRVLDARGLTKTYKKVRAVDDVSIHVAAGERLGLLGPNGAGKTTTLLMLLGAVLPDHGTIEIAGYRLPRHRSKAMQHVGFAAGYLPLPDRLKVREALGVFAGWYGVRNERQAVDDTLERFGDHAVRRSVVQLVVERPANAGGHREGNAAPAEAARARRADRLARPRHRAEGAHRAARVLHRHRRRAAGHQPRHARGRDAHRARRVPGPRHVVADDTPAAIVGAVRLRRPRGRVPRAGRDPRTLSPMSWHRIRVVIRRHAYVLWRAPHRWFDIAFWPLMDVILWGSLGVYVAQQDSSSQAATPFLIGGILMFHVLFQSQIAVATGFMEETWSRNLLNVLTTPVTELEYIAGTAVFGMAKVVLALTTLSVTAFVAFGFELERDRLVDPADRRRADARRLGRRAWPTSASCCGSGRVPRSSRGARNFILMALSGVFNPIEALPAALQPIARMLPSTHAFIALREVLSGNPLPVDEIVIGLIGGVVFVIAGFAFSWWMLRIFKRRGFVTRFS